MGVVFVDSLTTDEFRVVKSQRYMTDLMNVLLDFRKNVNFFTESQERE